MELEKRKAESVPAQDPENSSSQVKTPSPFQNMGDDDEQGKSPPQSIRLRIPREYYLLPGFMATTGATIGLFRGTRAASLRFLAENAHRPPTTLQGWYFYNKTKNYHMILGGLRQGGVDGLWLGLTGLGWVGLEEGMRRAGLDEVRELGAGTGTACMLAAICERCRVVQEILLTNVDLRVDRLPWVVARRAMFLGIVVGGTMSMLRMWERGLREGSTAG